MKLEARYFYNIYMMHLKLLVVQLFENYIDIETIFPHIRGRECGEWYIWSCIVSNFEIYIDRKNIYHPTIYIYKNGRGHEQYMNCLLSNVPPHENN